MNALPNKTEEQELRATMLWSMHEFIIGLDHADTHLVEAETGRFVAMGRVFLLTYQKLADNARRDSKAFWKVRPKLHYYAHLLIHIERTRQNPRRYHLFTAEDFMGRCKVIGRVCHRRRCCKRIVDRLLVFYLHRWHRHYKV